jgi:serine/threonine protein kinase
MQSVPHIPGYELFRCLGGGPLTTVWQARDCANDAACAVKALRPEWQGDSTAVKLLQREARAGLRVRHPHLVPLQSVHVTRPPYFLVMDLLAGESLRRRLRRDYRLDLATTLWITRQTAEALVALHRRGFVHGDVKPDNIRLVDDGTAVLMDLGFAHRPGENTALLRQGYVLGTVDFLAPELCGAEPAGDQASDMFSLGVSLFEMLTGKLPYPGGTVAQTLRRHHCDPPADIRQYAADLPAGLSALVGRLLSRRPSERPKAEMVVPLLIALEIAAIRQRMSA